MSFLTAALYGLGAYGKGKRENQDFAEKQREFDAQQATSEKDRQDTVDYRNAQLKQQQLLDTVTLRGQGYGPDGQPLAPLPIPGLPVGGTQIPGAPVAAPLPKGWHAPEVTPLPIPGKPTTARNWTPDQYQQAIGYAEANNRPDLAEQWRKDMTTQALVQKDAAGNALTGAKVVTEQQRPALLQAQTAYWKTKPSELKTRLDQQLAIAKMHDQTAYARMNQSYQNALVAAKDRSTPDERMAIAYMTAINSANDKNFNTAYAAAVKQADTQNAALQKQFLQSQNQFNLGLTTTAPAAPQYIPIPQPTPATMPNMSFYINGQPQNVGPLPLNPFNRQQPKNLPGIGKTITTQDAIRLGGPNGVAQAKALGYTVK